MGIAVITRHSHANESEDLPTVTQDTHTYFEL